MNITDPIRRNAQIIPDELAIVRSANAPLTYRELDQRIDYVARRIQELGLRPGQTAIVSNTRLFSFLVAALALARLGIASAPTHFPIAGVDIGLVEEGAEAVPGVRNARMDTAWFEGSIPSPEPVASDPDGSAVLRYFPSSGTTGTPKFAGISHDLMTRRIGHKWISVRLPDNPRAIIFVGLGIYYGMNSLLRVLWTGGQLVMSRGIEQVVPFIQHYGVNTLVLAPTTLRTILGALPPGFTSLPSLQAVEVGGSVLPIPLYEAARQRLCHNIINAYGAMELGMIAAAPMSAIYEYPGSVGYVVTGVDVEAVDDDDQPVGAGTEGVLRMRSEDAIDHYHGDPVTSAEVFRNGWVYPGDMGIVSATGMLTVTGRVSEVINNGGNKISPQLIEDVLMLMDSVGEAAAFGVPDDLGVTQIWAAIVPKGPIDTKALQAFCFERLKEKTPTRIIQVQHLPRTTTGKVQRDELRKLVTRGAGAQGAVTISG